MNSTDNPKPVELSAPTNLFFTSGVLRFKIVRHGGPASAGADRCPPGRTGVRLDGQVSRLADRSQACRIYPATSESYRARSSHPSDVRLGRGKAGLRLGTCRNEWGYSRIFARRIGIPVPPDHGEPAAPVQRNQALPQPDQLGEPARRPRSRGRDRAARR